MTDINDLYESADERDWTLDELAEREPDEPGQEPPLDLDEIEAMLRQTTGALSPAGHNLLDVAPLLVAELREARQRIAALEALPTRERWAATAGPDVPPGPAAFEFGTPRVAEREIDGKQLWRRMLSVHPWEPIDEHGPF